MLNPSFEPESYSCYSEGERLFNEASAISDAERWSDARRLFDAAAECFAAAKRLENARKAVEPSKLPSAPPADEGPAEITNSIGMKFKRIPPGEFMMGQNDGNENERPVHPVRITRDFYLGVHEVTQAHYRAVTGKNPSYFKGDDLPVETVSALDADEFCRLLTDKERAAGLLPNGSVYRLATEAQWEYAARAGTTTKWSFGDDEKEIYRFAWTSGNATHPVGKKQPNPWGLFDMHGNVWEWCLDSYGEYDASAVSDPAETRGGSPRHAETGEAERVPGVEPETVGTAREGGRRRGNSPRRANRWKPTPRRSLV